MFIFDRITAAIAATLAAALASIYFPVPADDLTALLACGVLRFLDPVSGEGRQWLLGAVPVLDPVQLQGLLFYPALRRW